MENNGIGVPISEMGDDVAEEKDSENMSSKSKKNKGKKKAVVEVAGNDDNLVGLLPNENPDIGKAEDWMDETFEFKADGSGGFSNLADCPMPPATPTCEDNPIVTWRQKKLNAALNLALWNGLAPSLGLIVSLATDSVTIGGVLIATMLLASFSFYHAYMKNV